MIVHCTKCAPMLFEGTLFGNSAVERRRVDALTNCTFKNSFLKIGQPWNADHNFPSELRRRTWANMIVIRKHPQNHCHETNWPGRPNFFQPVSQYNRTLACWLPFMAVKPKVQAGIFKSETLLRLYRDFAETLLKLLRQCWYSAETLPRLDVWQERSCFRSVDAFTSLSKSYIC